MNMTETSARRLTWAVFAATVVMYAVGAAVGAATHTLGGVVDVAFAVMMFVFPLVGIMICTRQPRNRIGWILLAIGVVWGVGVLLQSYGQWGHVEEAGALVGWDVALALGSNLWVPAVGLMGTFLILLFPDGHLPTPRWAPVAWFCAVMLVVAYVAATITPGKLEVPGPEVSNPLGVEALRPYPALLLAPYWLLPVCFALCAVALVLRFRLSRGVERLQLKWLALAATVLAVAYLVSIVGSAPFTFSGGREPGWALLLENVSIVCFGLVPVAIGVAVLRHRLFEIDVVISKAVVVGALAVFITVVYVGIVVLLGAALPRVVARDNLALSIVATAVVAVAFEPVRVRVQRYANRLVYGARATPYEVLSDFASRMRGSAAWGEVLPQMARTVGQGVGAVRAEVWLKVGGSLTREAVWPADADAVAPVAVVDDGAVPPLGADRVVAVRQEGELLGAITVTEAAGESMTPTEDKLLGDVAAQTGLVLRNARLIEELRMSRQRLVKAQDEERRRLERDLHDGAQQSLVSVALTLRMASGQLSRVAPEAVPPLEQASEQLATAIDELRELARGIHPAILTERGLGPALNSLAERSPLPVTVEAHLDRRPPPTIEATAYFVVAEALTNAAKYAEASHVTVTADSTDNLLTTTVADDGKGGAKLSLGGSGLRGLTDRVSAADGDLEIESPPGHGTRVTCRLPLPPEPEPAGSQDAQPNMATGHVVGAPG